MDTTSVIVGMFLGMFLGAMLGVLAAALMVAAGSADEAMPSQQ